MGDDLGYLRDNFAKFLELNRKTFNGKDVVKLVAAYVEEAPLPFDLMMHKDLDEIEDKKEKTLKTGEVERLEAHKESMKKTREDKVDMVKTEWELDALSDPAWQDYLAQAEAWVCTCEELQIAWDQYEQKRRVFQIKFGEPWGF